MNIVKNEQLDRENSDSALCPQGRLSRPTKEFRGRQIVNIFTYTPYFLSAVNNALSRGASKRYLKMFGIGIVEWRVASMLAIEPNIPASRICDVVSLDKSGTSRALKRLAELKHVSFEASDTDPRRKLWRLNAQGYDLHDRVLVEALERERKLISGIEPADLEIFLKVIRKMRKNVDRLETAPR